MTGWEALISSFGLSFASGVNLYATVLVVGLAQHFGLVESLPGPLESLSSPWVLGIAGVLYGLEFLADKFPFVATVWDTFHTVIRPLGGALLALGAAHDMSPLGQAAVMLLGGSVALGSHSTKAGFRMMANTVPEPTTHSVISLAEDIGVVGLTALTLAYPWAALAVITVLVCGMAFLAPTIWRTLKFTLSCSWGILSAAVGAHPRPDQGVPDWLQQLLVKNDLKTNDLLVYRGFARSNAGGPRYGSGYLVLGGDTVSFAREGIFRNSLRQLGPTESLTLESGVVCDTVVSAGGDQSTQMRVCLAKHWGSLFQHEFSDPAMANAPDGI